MKTKSSSLDKWVKRLEQSRHENRGARISAIQSNSEDELRYIAAENDL